ncbi:MAG TPA: lipid A-modifier LpxR family protein, partial [Planctomycetota bacterium]|nr:lipid A-modifier LpxR family protein [Planctomycetota bacterium]
MDHPHTGPNIRRLFRAALLLGAGLSAIGCVATIDNDARGFGGDDDRWYTGGWRLQRDLAAGVPDSERSWLDAGADAVAAHLDLLPAGADEPPGFTTVSLVAGQQFFTPANLKASTLIEDDRPYAGWLYAGVVRFDTWLDSDDGARRDVEHSVELDLGVVGPDSYAEQIQSALHSSLVDGQDPEGWDHQLGNEPGIVLRLSRAARDGYAERAPGGLAADAISR